MLEQVKELMAGIPPLAIAAVVILVVIGAIWFWKWRQSKQVADKENEVLKGVQNASMYASMIQKNLDSEDEKTALTKTYPTEVANGLEDFEKEEEEDDDDNFEPM